MTDPRFPFKPDAAGSDRRTLADFALPSEPGNEREAMKRVADAVGELV